MAKKLWYPLAWYAWQLSVESLLYLAQGADNFADPFRPKFTQMLPWVLTHGVTASLVLAIGPVLFLTRRHHALWGRLYLGLALVAGLTALPLSWRAEGGPVAQAGFISLNLAWLAATWGVWTQKSHRDWVILHYTLTFSAVLSRVGLSLADYMDCDFALSYPILAWTSWLPGLLWSARRFRD
jgi:ABC-type multidrug transport system permease subunit